MTSIVVNPLHGYYRRDHLEHVVDEMRRRGAPRLRAFYDSETGIWHAREGTHRLRAAKALGLVPTLVPVPWRRTRAALVRATIAASSNAHVFLAQSAPEGLTAASAMTRSLT